MPATPAWLASVEAVFDRNIAASNQARALTKNLEGTSLQVDIEGVTRIRAACAGGRMALLAGDDSPADAVICGSPPALIQMLRAGSAPVQVRGDAEIANSYRDLFRAARPDLEEELSRWVGDLPARHLAQIARSVRTWARRARRSAGENIAEYLQEEGRDLITKTELEEFLRAVDGVRDGVERIDARLRHLEQRVKAG
jgi:ubiquinone biosynthesis protein UbiJ